MLGGNFFSTDTKSFNAEIKKRYSDFIVEEITLNKKICKVKFFLTEKKKKPLLKIPENKKKKKFIHFNLEKINTDLSFALRNIARKLFVSRKRLGYAGIKDKRAITCQKISFYVKNYDEVNRLKQLKLNRIYLSNVSWEDYGLDLGMLYGNRFTITLRSIDLKKKELNSIITECFKQMKLKGVPNYFGMQRFGGVRRVSHLIGKSIIQGRIKEAVMLFLTYDSKDEKPEVREARKNLLLSNDFAKAFKEFPKELFLEKAILNFLVKHPKDFTNAFRKIPRNIRYFFTHAYQSYLFNKIIDERFRQGIGLRPLEGEPIKDGVPLGLLPGYNSKLSNGIIGEIERNILSKEGISLNYFKVKELPECSSKGSRKKILLKPLRPKIIDITKDELSKGKMKAIISFTLTKGNYATTILRELLKKKELI